jgi:outer membrane receptor for ferrienterochelin and colicins
MPVVPSVGERRFVILVGAVALTTLVGASLGAQETPSASIAGRVTETGGTPVGQARVQVFSLPSRDVAGGATSAEDGTYRVRALRAGTYTVLVARIGYTPAHVDTVRVAAGETQTVNVTLATSASQLDQIVTTATRGAEPEKILDSPNSISVVSAERIAERPSATITDHLKSTPGLAISTGGIAQANIVSRGFNNAFSTSMLMLQDYRFAGVPSLRVNVPFLFTGTNEDIERIEVLQGPAAALYGPNSGNGVLHVITKSPFQSAGTTLTVDGGERSLGRVSARNAGIFPGNKWAYKLSGEYFTAHDWQYRDPNEPAAFSTTDARVPASRRGQAVSRDFDLRKYTGEARLDFQPSEDTELITTAGMSKIGRGMEITTTFGAAQVRNWSYSNLQERFRHKKFFAQVFYNASNSGNADSSDASGTYYLRTGIPVVDKSSVLVGQLQQGLQLGPTKIVLGGDYIATRPRTEGTINGRNENDDDINETGGYVQTTTAITSMLDFLAAARVDVNSRIDGTQFSPRAALVFKPAPNQNFRVTFNRAFNSPASFSFFLDQYSGRTPAPGMPVQIIGNPAKEGWHFARSCDQSINGGLCMRSPYASGLVPASAAAAFPGLVLALPTIVRGLPASSFGAGGETARAQVLGLLTQLNPILTRLAPTNAQVGTVLVDLNPTPPRPLTSAPADYAPLGANFSNTFEVGYKGLIGDRVHLDGAFWFQRRPADPTTQVINPGVLFNPTQLGAFLGQGIAQGLIAAGTPAAQAQATATAAAGALTPLAAAIPVGATAFTNTLDNQPFLIFSYQNAAGYVNVHGVDLAGDLLLTDEWSLEGTYSWLNKNVFPDAPGATLGNPLTANAPKHRATATIRYADEVKGFSGEVRGRYADAFQVNSGVFNSYGVGGGVRYPGVPVNAFLDAGVSWRIPSRAGQLRWSINAQNILDNKVQSFVGVPEIGRLILTRIQYAF